MAERRTTDSEVDLGGNVIELLPEQDCRSPRPRTKRTSSISCIPVPIAERWTDGLLASMKTIGSFRRRSRPDAEAPDLIKAARCNSADSSDQAVDACPAASKAREETTSQADDTTPIETSHAWPLFKEGASIIPAEDPQATGIQFSFAQKNDSAGGTATAAHLSQAGVSQAPAQQDSGHAAGTKAPSCTPQLSCHLSEALAQPAGVPEDALQSRALPQAPASEDNKYAILAQLLASKELAAHIAANSTVPGALPDRQDSANLFSAAADAQGAAASQQLQAKRVSSALTCYNGRGRAMPAATPAGGPRQAAARQAVGPGGTEGGPYEYAVATGSPRRLQFRGGPTAEDAARAMYARAVAARERAARRQEAARALRQAAEEAQCSFSPRTNRARNDALLAGLPAWPAAADAPRPASAAQGKRKPPRTPRLAGRTISSPSQLSDSSFCSPSHQHSLGELSAEQTTRLDSPRQLSNAHTKNAASSRGKAAADIIAEVAEEPKGNAGIRAGQRLYAEALRSLERQQTAAHLTIQEELEEMRAAAPRARGLPPSVYGAGAVSRVTLIRTRSISPRRRNPAYQDLMKECTFKPKTMWRSRSAARAPRSRSLGRHQVPPAGRQRPQRASISTDEALDRFLRRASLTADTVPELLHLTDADQGRQPGDESSDAPDQAAAIAESLERLALGGNGSADGALTEGAAKSGEEAAEQLPRQLMPHSEGLAPDLDFEEFLQRQKAFVEERARKVEATRAQTARRLGKTIGISPGSRSLLRQWKTVERKASLHRGDKENGSRRRPPMHAWSLDEAFRPQITRRAQRKKARSVQELHEGGRLQRERTLEQLRLERTAAEEAQLTFAPSINPCYSIASRPLLDLADPGLYLAHAQTQRRRLEVARQAAAEELQERELAECTFSPRTIPLPAFLQRMSSTHGSNLHSPSKSDLDSYAQQVKWL